LSPAAGPAALPRGLAAKSAAGRARLAAVFLFLAALAILAQPTAADIWVGLPFVIAGGSIRAWSAGYLLKTAELATAGPYAFSRNPLYLGRLLLLTGFGIMARLPGQAHLVLLALGYAVFFLYYLPRKEKVEGDRLRERHGEAYRRYEKEVPALFPRRTPYAGGGGSRQGWRRERFLRNREYLMVVLEAGLVVLFAFRVWR
jgi:protein-S-isoprenylcysteine O-methyltransferase Ste14